MRLSRAVPGAGRSGAAAAARAGAGAPGDQRCASADDAGRRRLLAALAVNAALLGGCGVPRAAAEEAAGASGATLAQAAAGSFVGWWRGRRSANGGAKLLAPIYVAQRRLREADDMLSAASSIGSDEALAALQLVRASSLNCYMFDALESDTIETKASLLTQKWQLSDPCTFRIVLKNVTDLEPAATQAAAQAKMEALVLSYQKLDAYLDMAREGSVDAIPKAREELRATMVLAADIEAFVKATLGVARRRAALITPLRLRQHRAAPWAAASTGRTAGLVLLGGRAATGRLGAAPPVTACAADSAIMTVQGPRAPAAAPGDAQQQPRSAAAAVAAQPAELPSGRYGHLPEPSVVLMRVAAEPPHPTLPRAARPAPAPPLSRHRDRKPLTASLVGPGRAGKPGFLAGSQGSIYEGAVRAGRPHGRGRLTVAGSAPGAPSRLAYEGSFANGVRHGDGTAHYPNGEDYVGAWEAGKRSGPGKLTYTDGSCYDGLWRADRRHGAGVLTAAGGGSVFVGSFADDVRVGLGTTYMPARGRKYVAEYVGGRPTCGAVFDLCDADVEPLPSALRGALAAGGLALRPGGARAPAPLPALGLCQPSRVTAREFAAVRRRAPALASADGTFTAETMDLLRHAFVLIAGGDDLAAAVLPHQLQELAVLAGLDPAAPACVALLDALAARAGGAGLGLDAFLHVVCYFRQRPLELPPELQLELPELQLGQELPQLQEPGPAAEEKQAQDQRDGAAAGAAGCAAADGGSGERNAAAGEGLGDGGLAATRVRARAGGETFARGVATDSRERRPQNVDGAFFVDHTCIDCDTCRMMAPETFGRVDRQSAVTAQPADAGARVRALQALLSCPTFSIHAEDRTSAELKAAQHALPAPVPGCGSVFACGWRSAKSYGGESFLILRPGGNVLVDSPRFNPVLAARLQELGGVRWIFLTHRDDVADHAKWAAHFGAERILHTREVNADTASVEHKLAGEGPWRLPDGGDDVELIFTPGHTEGHVCLHFAPDRALLSGDHLSAGYAPGEALFVFTEFNWYSVPQQLESVRKLLQWDWLHVLPGHGRPAHLRDAAHRLAAVSQLLEAHGAAAGAGAAQAASPAARGEPAAAWGASGAGSSACARCSAPRERNSSSPRGQPFMAQRACRPCAAAAAATAAAAGASAARRGPLPPPLARRCRRSPGPCVVAGAGGGGALEQLITDVDGFDSPRALAAHPALAQLPLDARVRDNLALLAELVPRVQGRLLTEHPRLLDADLASWLEFLGAVGFERAAVAECLRSQPEVFFTADIYVAGQLLLLLRHDLALPEADVLRSWARWAVALRPGSTQASMRAVAERLRARLGLEGDALLVALQQWPAVLGWDVEADLEPKLAFFASLGPAGQRALPTMWDPDTGWLQGLRSWGYSVQPKLELLAEVLGSSEAAAALLASCPAVLKLPVEAKLRPVLAALAAAGLGPGEQLSQLLRACPQLLAESREAVVSKLNFLSDVIGGEAADLLAWPEYLSLSLRGHIGPRFYFLARGGHLDAFTDPGSGVLQLRRALAPSLDALLDDVARTSGQGAAAVRAEHDACAAEWEELLGWCAEAAFAQQGSGNGRVSSLYAEPLNLFYALLM
ncbi:morn3 [Scenedesmus sp. PABB004]|nr:morn3 [Scenedesmus sp. PABB004]